MRRKFALILLAAGVAGCAWVKKPTYPASRVAQGLEAVCQHDYHLTVSARLKDKNLQVYTLRVGLYDATTMDLRRDVADVLQNVLEAASRVSLSTDAAIDFIQVKMIDAVTGASVDIWRYMPDMRKAMNIPVPTEEYMDRIVIERFAESPESLKPGQELQWDPPITMPEFLARQVAQRAMREIPVALQGFADSLGSGTLTMVMDRTSNAKLTAPVDEGKVAEAVGHAAHSVMRRYEFTGFRNVVLKDAHGASLRSWNL